MLGTEKLAAKLRRFGFFAVSGNAQGLIMTLAGGAATVAHQQQTEVKMLNLTARNAFRLGTAAALTASVLEVWMNLAVGIVGSNDNPVNQGFFGVVVTAAACTFVARFRPDGMARAMLAVAGVQALLAMAVATAPSTAQDPMGPSGVLALSAFFVALWLVAAALFHRSARAEVVEATP